MKLLTILIALLALMTAIPSAAQWTTETNVDVIVAGGSNSQSEPVSASSLWGGTIIAWRERVDDNYLLYAQRLDLDGVPQWGAGGIAITTEDDCSDLVIDGDGNGGAWIAWANNSTPSGSTLDIKIQHIDIDGNALGPPGGELVCGADNAQSDPVVYGSGLGAIVAWRDNRAWYHDRIYAQRVDADCVPQWAGGGVLVSPATGFHRYPKIVGTGDGNVIVVWHYENLMASLIHEADGSRPWGSGVIAADEVGSHENWDIAPDYSGGVLLVFERGYHKLAQRVAGDGTRPWVDDLPIASAANTHNVVMAATEDEACIIAWLDSRDGYSIWAQRLTPDGSTHWTVDGVRISSSNTANGPLDICWNGDFEEPGTCILSWKETVGLKAQSLGADGLPDWDEGGVLVSSGTGAYYDLVLCKDIDHGAVMAYRAGSGNNDIHAEHVNADGSLGVSGVSVPEQGGIAGLRGRAWPNPFHADTRLTMAASSGASVPAELEVYDVTGRRIRSLPLRREGEWLAAHWDGLDSSGRPVPAGLYFYRGTGGTTQGKVLKLR